jgi:hypothetical protein
MAVHGYVLLAHELDKPVELDAFVDPMIGF